MMGAGASSWKSVVSEVARASPEELRSSLAGLSTEERERVKASLEVVMQDRGLLGTRVAAAGQLKEPKPREEELETGKSRKGHSLEYEKEHWSDVVSFDNQMIWKEPEDIFKKRQEEIGSLAKRQFRSIEFRKDKKHTTWLREGELEDSDESYTTQKKREIEAWYISSGDSDSKNYRGENLWGRNLLLAPCIGGKPFSYFTRKSLLPEKFPWNSSEDSSDQYQGPGESAEFSTQEDLIQAINVKSLVAQEGDHTDWDVGHEYGRFDCYYGGTKYVLDALTWDQLEELGFGDEPDDEDEEEDDDEEGEEGDE